MTIKKLNALHIVAFSCVIMSLVDAIIIPQYFVKLVIKFTLFLILPVIFLHIKKISYSDIFYLNSSTFINSLRLGICVFSLILGSYAVANLFFDFSNVVASLLPYDGINPSNFYFVAIYTTFVNSLLEEFFFRGFAFLTLKQTENRYFTYFFSSFFFAIYHISILFTWGSILLTLLMMVVLFIAGIIFNILNEKNGNIYFSWFMHIFANFAINLIGLSILGII